MKYSKHFWVIFWGQLFSVVGQSLTWPFITIYLRETFQLPLATVTVVITIESIMTILATVLAGPYMDRFGRKNVMVLSLLINSVTFLLMLQASTFLRFVIIMSIRGLFTPLFRVGAHTMVADIVPAQDQFDAFSLTRTSANIGFAIGPALGGFFAVNSLRLSFLLSGIILGIVTLVVLFLLKETMPARCISQVTKTTGKPNGYKHIIKDKFFLIFLAADTLVLVGMVNMFNLLSVYIKENFGIPENQYGFIMTINAVMAAALQYPVTSIIKNKPPYLMLALSAVYFAIGLGSVALGDSFIHFAISMVIVTGGELILMPTGMSIVARMAPEALRGRYMGLHSLTMGVARGIGPYFGGVLNDLVAPAAIWYGSMLTGLTSAVIFMMLHRLKARTDLAATQSVDLSD